MATRTVVEDWESKAVNRHRPLEPKLRHVSQVLTKDAWRGRPCVVVGGGPSARELIPRLHIFPPSTAFAGANMSWRVDPAPEVIYGLDRQVFDLSENRWKDEWVGRARAGQVRVTGHHNAFFEWEGVYWVHHGEKWGTDFGDERTPGIIASNNAGLAAVNVVDILGADPIVLVGFDASSQGARLNWHDDYPEGDGWRPRRPEHTHERWRILARTVAAHVRTRVLNVNLESKFPLGERVGFEEAVRLCEKE